MQIYFFNAMPLINSTLLSILLITRVSKVVSFRLPAEKLNCSSPAPTVEEDFSLFFFRFSRVVCLELSHLLLTDGMSSYYCEQVGELCDKSFAFKEVIWTIPNVFRLTPVVDSYVRSLPFSFANASWHLEMYLNGQSFWNTQGYIDIMIRRLRSDVPTHEMFSKFFFRTRRGKEFQSLSASGTFDSNVVLMGVDMYLPYCEMYTKKDLIAPNDTVTVVCQLRTTKNNVAETYSQTEPRVTTAESYSQTGLRETAVEAYSQTELIETAVEVYTQTELIQEYGDDNNEVQLPTVSHDSKVLRDYKELLLSEEDCDVTIRVKGQDFRAHRSILRARSSVFASMFRVDMKEKATGVIDVEDCDPSTFPDFLHYLYCGSVERLSGENVFSLYAAADKYDVQDLKSECLEYMKSNLSVDFFCDTITLSLQYCETELLKLATNFFAKNLPKIIVTVKWQAFLTENPIQSNELLVKALASDKHAHD